MIGKPTKVEVKSTKAHLMASELAKQRASAGRDRGYNLSPKQ